MKRNILTLLMVALVAVTFAQVPRHLRVLRYVPDSCYSLSMVNLDTLARVMDLEAMHRENLLKPLYDSVKFSKKLVQSWIKHDSKLGVDFTGTAALVDSRYLLFPLNNERNFEKMLYSLDKTLPPFETMTDPSGRKIRCMTMEDEGMSVAVICTEDVACMALLTDLNAMYSSELFFSTETDTVDLEAMFANMNQETPMRMWDRLSRSHFAESDLAAKMLDKGWDSYTAYNYGNPLVNAYMGAMQLYFPTSVEIKHLLSQLNMEIFAKGEVRRDRITAISEFHQHSTPSDMQALKSSPKDLKKLMPYVSGDFMILAVSAMEGYGDLAEPNMGAFPQWQVLCPLMNKPFVFTASALDEVNMQVVTLVEHPEKVCGILERYVEVCNHITDSTYKAHKAMDAQMIEEEVVEEPLDLPVESEEPEKSETDAPVVMELPFSMDLFEEDTTINMKTLSYKKIDGFDAYIIATKKRSMDYETYTWVVKEDSSCVLVKDGLLFYTKSLSSTGSLSQPFEREWPKEYFEHPFYARVDFNSFVTLFGPDAAMPIRDMTCVVEDNTFTMNINAVPGLHHGIIYEMVKYVIDVIK